MVVHLLINAGAGLWLHVGPEVVPTWAWIPALVGLAALPWFPAAPIAAGDPPSGVDARR